MSRREIYNDGERTLEVDGSALHIRSAKRHFVAYLPGLIVSRSIPARISDYLRTGGQDPSAWRTVMSGKTVVCVLPTAAADVAAVAASAARTAADTALRDQSTAERSRVHEMFKFAGRYRDYPDKYFTLLYKAQSALSAWREKYPDAAKAEDRQSLLADAEELENLAKGALVYDADGSLSSEDQQRRHDDLLAQANAKRAEANRIRE